MNAPVTSPTVPPYHHTPLFPLGPDKTPYRKLEVGGVSIEKVMGKDMLVVSHEALRALAEAAFTDINHLLRPAHLKQLRGILDDPEASANDKFLSCGDDLQRRREALSVADRLTASPTPLRQLGI